MESASDLSLYCSTNNLTRSCIRTVLPSASLTARILTPVCGNVISCDSLEVRILLRSTTDIIDSTIRLVLGSDTLDLLSPLLSLSGRDTLVITLFDLSDGDSIYFSLIHAQDESGAILSSPVGCSFTIDQTPPFVSVISPLTMSYVNDVFPVLLFNVSDPSGIDLSSLYAIINGTDSIPSHAFTYESGVLMLDFSTLGYAVSDMETVSVELFNIRDSSQFCDANNASIVNLFITDQTPPYLELLFPFDGAFVSCPDSGIFWRIWDFSAIVMESSVVVIDADTFSLSDPVFTYNPSDSTLLFSPPTPFVDGSTVFVSWLSLSDIPGNSYIPSPFNFTIDLSPPYVESFYPPFGSIVSDIEPSSYFIVRDLLSGVNPLSIEVSFNGLSGLLADVSGFYMISDTVYWSAESAFVTFSSGDTVRLCILSMQDQPDLCPPNILSTPVCSEFYINAEGPHAVILSPSDEMFISCADSMQEISLRIIDRSEIIWDSLLIRSDGSLFDSYSPEISIEGDTVFFRPSRAWESGDTVDFTLLRCFDIEGLGLDETLSVRFFIDLDPPVIFAIDPLPGSVITDSFRLSALT